MSGTQSLSESDARAVAAAEADLDRLLAVEPSGEFAAKVWARIAAETPSRKWRWTWLALPLAGAAAVILAITLHSGTRVDENRGAAATPRHDDIVLSRTPDVGAVVFLPPAPATTLTNRNRRGTAARLAAEPEILIDPAIGDAVRRLATAARNTSLDGTSNLVEEPGNSELAELSIPEPLSVPELVVKPADDPGGE